MGQDGGGSFEEFFAAAYGRLVGLLFAFLHDRAEAEDAVQDAFASALLRWPVRAATTTPRRGCGRSPSGGAIDHQRRSARLLRVLARLGPPSSAPPVGAEHVDLLRALRKVPVAQREVLVLHYVAELAVDQVAAELRLPVGTVKSRLARGRAALANELQPGVGTPDEESTNA